MCVQEEVACVWFIFLYLPESKVCWVIERPGYQAEACPSVYYVY